MRRYFNEMKAAIERHGGTEKFDGDAVVASLAGVPVVYEDDALRAVRAAAEMRERLTELNSDFERSWGVAVATRTGVNTGEVIAGDPSTRQSFVVGEAVNMAGRPSRRRGRTRSSSARRRSGLCVTRSSPRR